MKNSELIGASPLFHARVTGFVGLALLASGSFASFVASKIIVRGDVVVTSNNMVASELLHRVGISSSLVMMIAWLFYALLLYRLLRPVKESLAMSMVVLVVVSVPIYMLNQVNLFAALLAASNQSHDQVNLFLDLHRFGSLIAAIFFGLWLLPLGLLVFRSSFLPKPLGVFLVIGSLGYLVLFFQEFFFFGAEHTLWSNPFLVVTHLSELALLIWLLVKGVNVEQWRRDAA